MKNLKAVEVLTLFLQLKTKAPNIQRKHTNSGWGLKWVTANWFSHYTYSYCTSKLKCKITVLLLVNLNFISVFLWCIWKHTEQIPLPSCMTWFQYFGIILVGLDKEQVAMAVCWLMKVKSLFKPYMEYRQATQDKLFKTNSWELYGLSLKT